jgi:hypothetical protein
LGAPGAEVPVVDVGAAVREIVAEDCPIVPLSLIWDNGTGGHH